MDNMNNKSTWKKLLITSESPEACRRGTADPSGCPASALSPRVARQFVISSGEAVPGILQPLSKPGRCAGPTAKQRRHGPRRLHARHTAMQGTTQTARPTPAPSCLERSWYWSLQQVPLATASSSNRCQSQNGAFRDTVLISSSKCLDPVWS